MDKADILKPDKAGLRKRLAAVIDRMEKIDADDPKEESDPRVRKLLEEGLRICACLNPIVRERCRDDPAALAEWDSIMRMCDGLDEPDHSP